MPKMNIEGREWVRPSNRHNIVKYIMFWRKFFRDNKFDVVYYNTCDMVALDILKFAKEASGEDNRERSFVDKIQKCFKLNLKDYCAKREVFGKEIGKEYDNIKSKE